MPFREPYRTQAATSGTLRLVGEQFTRACDGLKDWCRLQGFVPHEIAQLIADALAKHKPDDCEEVEACELLSSGFADLSESLYFADLEADNK